MATLRHSLIPAAIILAVWSCGTLYSQEYDRYYYEEEYYDGGYQKGSISFSVFYNELKPYGRWINSRTYGRVWIPDVGRDFHPYASHGYWVMTDYGNTWVSDFSWGWAPFHYGRWYYDDYYGWAWIPGYEWAPAWVIWRSGGGYYGWAPMGPGININININIPRSYWTFLPSRYMYNRSMHRYYNRYSSAIYNKTSIIKNTHIYNNNRYYSGPNTKDYERETGRKTIVRRLESNNNRANRATTRISENSVTVYKPDASNGRKATTRSSENPTGSRFSNNRSDKVAPQRSSGDSKASTNSSTRSNGRESNNSGRSSERK